MLPISLLGPKFSNLFNFSDPHCAACPIALAHIVLAVSQLTGFTKSKQTLYTTCDTIYANIGACQDVQNEPQS